MTTPIQVLLIEDNPGDVELTRETLESGKLFVQIHVATDGVDAMAYLLGEGKHAGAAQPDLILLDLNLPRMDGRQVLGEIATHDDLRSIPVVILTSSDRESDVLASYGLGANCYVKKPVDLASFQSIVSSIEDFWFTVVKLPRRCA